MKQAQAGMVLAGVMLAGMVLAGMMLAGLNLEHLASIVLPEQARYRNLAAIASLPSLGLRRGRSIGRGRLEDMANYLTMMLSGFKSAWITSTPLLERNSRVKSSCLVIPLPIV